ncbi:MAG: cysteine--tRNA ligase [Negativicutes bacterium]|nr:cysteine--tRNA ligase [Negativicutes bacterium]
MAIKVYNTLSRKKEEFVPRTPGRVGMYVCGITPYNHPHIGNARPPVVWDVIRRYLEYRGYQVDHVQNYTDVDDKIIAAAQREGVDCARLARRYIDEYEQICRQLGVLPPAVTPRVSEHIPEIVAMIGQLLDNGHAYRVDGDVYFRVESFAGYGKLSGRSLDDMQAGARVEVDERKEHPLDFALWKSAKPGEPAWDSPWGPGRPGWHIECSAMSMKYLGQQFDLHGGGSDLIFPHHENEIAQSEGATGLAPFVRYWLHNGFVTVDQEKMSKSLGNFSLVREILDRYPGEVLRFLILSAHYRSPLDFSDERLDEARRSLSRLVNGARGLAWLRRAAAGSPGSPAGLQLLAEAERCRDGFCAAMDDDFNTALALAELFGLVKAVNACVSQVKSSGAQVGRAEVEKVAEIFDVLTGILGVGRLQPDTAAPDSDEQLVDGLLDLLLEVRQKARQNRDFATADWLRQELAGLGIVIEDGRQGSSWRRQS